MIPFSDLGAQHKELKKQINEAIAKVIKRGDFILGEEVKLFENEFAHFCNSRYAVGVSSGTEAIFLALLSLGIGKGDEVIVPAFTYIATALAISYTGAKPVFVDIDEKTYNIDSEEIEKAITKNTKVIIPVHLYGQPANMPAVLQIAKQYNLRVIEDAAQAHGATIKFSGGNEYKTGNMGDIGCFSFYPSKNLGAMGDGGMITTDNEESYKKICMLRDYGRISKYEHTLIGYNSRLDTMQAAILRIKLKRLPKWNKMRQKAAQVYNRLLEDLNLITPYTDSFVKHVYHVYAVRIKKRDEAHAALKAKDIAAIIHYPIPLHLQKAYQQLSYTKGDFPVSEQVAQEVLSLPMYPHIKEQQIKIVASVLKGALKK